MKVELDKAEAVYLSLLLSGKSDATSKKLLKRLDTAAPEPGYEITLKPEYTFVLDGDTSGDVIIVPKVALDKKNYTPYVHAKNETIWDDTYLILSATIIDFFQGAK